MKKSFLTFLVACVGGVVLAGTPISYPKEEAAFTVSFPEGKEEAKIAGKENKLILVVEGRLQRARFALESDERRGDEKSRGRRGDSARYRHERERDQGWRADGEGWEGVCDRRLQTGMGREDGIVFSDSGRV